MTPEAGWHTSPPLPVRSSESTQGDTIVKAYQNWRLPYYQVHPIHHTEPSHRIPYAVLNQSSILFPFSFSLQSRSHFLGVPLTCYLEPTIPPSTSHPRCFPFPHTARAMTTTTPQAANVYPRLGALLTTDASSAPSSSHQREIQPRTRPTPGSTPPAPPACVAPPP